MDHAVIYYDWTYSIFLAVFDTPIILQILDVFCKFLTEYADTDIYLENCNRKHSHWIFYNDWLEFL